MAAANLRNVQLNTSAGTIVLELYWNHAPKTCENFVKLVDQGHYENVVFHRVVKNFLIQTGDPTGTGRGGRTADGNVLEDEIHPQLKFVGAGILAMATSGGNAKNTGRSQFFITLAPAPHLNGTCAIFGRVKSGMAVVERIGLTAVDKQFRPADPIKVHSAAVLQA